MRLGMSMITGERGGYPQVCQSYPVRRILIVRKALPDILHPPQQTSASSLFRPRRFTSVNGGVFYWLAATAFFGIAVQLSSRSAAMDLA
jgi:hypothetical protein